MELAFVDISGALTLRTLLFSVAVVAREMFSGATWAGLLVVFGVDFLHATVLYFGFAGHQVEAVIASGDGTHYLAVTW